MDATRFLYDLYDFLDLDTYFTEPRKERVPYFSQYNIRSKTINYNYDEMQSYLRFLIPKYLKTSFEIGKVVDLKFQGVCSFFYVKDPV